MKHGIILLVLAACAACGTDGAPRYGGEPSAAESAYGDCSFCHTELATHMADTGGHQSLDLKCQLCHENLTPGRVGLGHRSVPACADCHPSQVTHHDPAAAAADQCIVCHTPHGSTNLVLIRPEIQTPNDGLQPITFTNMLGEANGSYASSSRPGTGLCEVCHTTTRHYRSDGSGTAHFTSPCSDCHPHQAGFSPVGPTETPTDTPEPPTLTPTPTDTPPPGASPTPTTPAVTQLVARRVETAPAGIDDPIWQEIAPLVPALANLSTGLLYGDGELNMTGTFGGLDDFNAGEPADLELRAVHDGSKVYILAEWNDTTFDLDRRRWLFNGPTDPLKAAESAEGWTSQRNDDKIGLAFEIEGASSEFGDFGDVGCAAACHNVGEGGLDMRPSAGKVDIWHWKTARSEPLGYVDDQVSDAAAGRRDDAGVSIENRNRPAGGNNRSGPFEEWDGTPQEFTRWDGRAITLDPAYILLDGHRMPFEGDAAAGEVTYADDCATCHGDAGEGGIGPALTAVRFTRMTRAELDEAIAAPTHPGAAAYTALTPTEQVNLLARLRGFSGIPGYYLTQPEGSVADIVTQSNVDYTLVNNTRRTSYRLLIIRALDTGNDDDAQFSPGQDYVFGVALMDDDGRNHVGSRREVLSLQP